ncbi:EF2563 family selenium-dependent molybdenum hydroxylase system protein [Candidatus Bipolaricaulota bacterium]|nr:EF2563 family selenium-dependent molybdenum hydroxylase system protein [Candidatus Bipolaricaulota bacterium]
MKKLSELIVLIKGGGEVASSVAHRLHCNHLRVCLTEITDPLAVSRGTSFCEAVFDGKKTIEGVTAELVVLSRKQIHRVWQDGNIPIVVDPETSIKEKLKPDVLIDAVMAKLNTQVKINDAPLVIGLGPGFYAGRDVDIVVETNHSNNLGRIITAGKAEENTGIPIAINGLAQERVIWAPRTGIFTTNRKIGDRVDANQIVGQVENRPLKAPISGMLRGLLRSGVEVAKNAKLIEVDPINDRAVCYLIRDKMRTISGGVLEAIMRKFNPDYALTTETTEKDIENKRRNSSLLFFSVHSFDEKNTIRIC